MNIEIMPFDNKNKNMLKKFVKFAWDLYKGDKKWVPQLNMELLGNKLFKAVGLLTSEHPFHEHAEVTYFLAQRDGKTVGRIAGIVNQAHIDYHEEKAGFFGFFESIDDNDVVKALLDNVREWLKSKGMETMRGPANFSSNESWGLLVENYDDYPMVYTPYNKKYYEKLLFNYGFKKSMDLTGMFMLAQDITEEDRVRRARLEKISARVKQKHGITVRPVRLGKKDFHEEIGYIRHIYQNAWEKNWGFIPITEHEFDDAAVGMQMMLKPGLASIAFVNDEPAGFIVNLPDVNEISRLSKSILGNSDLIRIIRMLFRKKKQKRVRLLLFGIVNQYRKIGLDSVLFVDSFRNAQEIGIEECEISWLLETNTLVIRHGEAMNAKEYRRWRLYDYPLK
jgi:hypothetical protein